MAGMISLMPRKATPATLTLDPLQIVLERWFAEKLPSGASKLTVANELKITPTTFNARITSPGRLRLNREVDKDRVRAICGVTGWDPEEIFSEASGRIDTGQRVEVALFGRYLDIILDCGNSEPERKAAYSALLGIYKTHLA